MRIKTFGEVDERSLQQLQRCMEAGDAEFGVLCADHHPGYSQPIGGAVAYEGYVSPSGVGYDIGCLARGMRVTLDEGFSVPIERFDGSVAPRCWDGRQMRAIKHATSLAARGPRETIRLTLANDRVLNATGDHLIRTKLGWREASLLRPGDRIACFPFIGLRGDRVSGEVAIDEIREPVGARKVRCRRAELAERELWPLQLEDPRLPALLRLLGFLSGDGHLTRDGKSVIFYTFCNEDAVAVRRDLRALGFEPRVDVRSKAPKLKPEIAVRVNSVALVALLTSMGSPVGKKRWPASPMPWLFELPAWLRSQFVSGFASADMSGPSLVDGRLVNIALKQVGLDSNAPLFVAQLLATLGFRTGISWRPSANGRTEYVLQLLGGESEQLRFLEEIGYCYSYARRVAAAATSSVAWQRCTVVEQRRRAHAAARELKAQGSRRQSILELVSQEFGVSTSFVHHSMYGRGAPRSPKGLRFEPDHSGEIAWVAVRSVGSGDVVDVFDVVTNDPAESFLAEGVVVHNCGNKAARTELTRPDLDALGGVERIMDEITRRISFGMGVAARERVDHPVLEKIRTTDFGPQRKLAQLAESQLGTVGSGNHYVDVMEDEEGHIWVGVHFGSRGFGHKTASGFLSLAQGLPFGERAHEGEMDSPPVLLPVDSELGQSYVAAMQLAGEYAYAGRDTVVSKVLEILGADATDEVHNHHNFCIAGSALVQTPNGFRRMDELAPGASIYALDPERGLCKTSVVDVWHSGSKPVYSIATDSRRIRCSAEHPILTVRVETMAHPERPWHKKARGRLEWKRARELTVGDVIVCAQTPCTNGGSIGQDRARLIGALLGDGWVRSKPLRRGYTVGLAIGAVDEPHTGKYLDLCRGILTGRWRSGAPGHYGLSCSSKEAFERYHAFQFGARTLDKFVPAYAFGLRREEKLALLAGYFDTDGSVASDSTPNHGRGTIASTNRTLVEGIRELAVRSGLRVTPIRSRRVTTNYGSAEVHRCVVAASSMVALDLWHERKRSNLRSSFLRTHGLRSAAIGYLNLPDGVFAQRVRSVELENVEDVYDLEVAHESHTFVCEGIVVHNCWREEHFGRQLWVIRKGCTPARPGQEGFVGATMGDDSVILEGIEGPGATESLYSTVHGAGRVMSRTQAAGKVRRRKKWACRNRDCDRIFDSKHACPDHPDAGVGKVWVEEQLKPGVVDWPAVQARLRERGIVLVGGGPDEAPEVYKRLTDVLAAHEGTIRVKHVLHPLGVAMAGRDVYDPYKD